MQRILRLAAIFGLGWAFAFSAHLPTVAQSRAAGAKPIAEPARGATATTPRQPDSAHRSWTDDFDRLLPAVRDDLTDIASGNPTIHRRNIHNYRVSYKLTLEAEATTEKFEQPVAPATS